MADRVNDVVKVADYDVVISTSANGTGSNFQYTGEEAKQVIKQLEDRAKGLLYQKQLILPDGESIEFSCICSWTKSLSGAVELSQRECKTEYFCIKDVDRKDVNPDGTERGKGVEAFSSETERNAHLRNKNNEFDLKKVSEGKNKKGKKKTSEKDTDKLPEETPGDNVNSEETPGDNVNLEKTPGENEKV